MAALASILLSACATGGGAVPRPFPSPSSDPRDGSVITGSTSPVVLTALSFVGVPYRNGGADPRGFDCSGFVQYVFGRHGISTPRSVEDLFDTGKRVSSRDIRPGDLLFFRTNGRGASHVGIATGRDAFVHAPSERGRVRVERFTGEYWARRFVGVRRVAH